MKKKRSRRKMAETRGYPRVSVLFLFLLLRLFVSSEGVTELNAKKEKASRLRFYFHDIVVGDNQSAVMTVPPAKGFPWSFGTVTVMDDALTLGPGLESEKVGSAQGLYVAAGLKETRLLMVMNFVFESGKYNGSTLSILGSNAVFNEIREMPILGGTGLFRFARGIAQARTHFFDIRTGNAIVRYDVTVLHY